MALVLLPCDLPSWSGLEKLLWCLRAAVTPNEVVCIMAKIRELCCISLDTDEDEDHAIVFVGLRDFLENYCSVRDRLRFFEITLPVIVDLALSVKDMKPVGGLRFSLQQQKDSVTLRRSFVASLLALSVLCAYPKRTLRSHPTLVDFSFSRFYSSLPRSPSQQAKFRATLQYFDRFAFTLPLGTITFHRKVMPGRQWLPIEAWLHSNVPLAKVVVKEDGSIEDDEATASRVCFGTSRPGEGALECDLSQESLMYCMHPELLAQCLWTESLEDNECICVEGVQRISTLQKDSHKAVFDPGIPPHLVGHHDLTIVCMDAEDYSDCPIKQYEEDNILRELNKAFLGFSHEVKPLQKPEASQLMIRRNLGKLENLELDLPTKEQKKQNGRNSENGKKSLPVVVAMIPKKSSDSTGSNRKCKEIHIRSRDSGIQSEQRRESNEKVTCDSQKSSSANAALSVMKEDSASSVDDEIKVDAAGNFLLPSKRRPSLVEVSQTHKSVYKTCNSDMDDFKSANSSLDIEDILDGSNEASRQLFFDRLNSALKKERSTSETESGYAVDAVIERPDGNDEEQVRLVRGNSRGFVLTEDDDPDSFSGDGLEREKQWLKNFRQKSSSSRSGSGAKDNASRYSFSSDFSSDSEVYEKAADWLDESPEKHEVRNHAVARFAKGLLKRTLSDSYSKVAKGLHEIPEKPKQKDLAVKSESNEVPLLPRSNSLSESLSRGIFIPDIQSEDKKESENLEESVKVDDADDFVAPDGVVLSPLSPKIVTPPRMRRGSVTLKRAKERSSTRPKQRGRSNSVPVALDAAQIQLFSERMTSLKHSPPVPSIVVSSEDDGESILNRRHKSTEILRSPLLSADVVEGFSFTFAENLIEGILREYDSLKGSNNSLHIPVIQRSKRKGILKNSSSIDSIDRSPTSSLSEISADEEDVLNSKNNQMDRCSSMPSLRDFQKVKPILTGNWGCGNNQKGDHQLKALIQWLAASRAHAPYMLYLTRGHPSLQQLKDVIQIISGRGWTVGQLTGAILTHSQTKMAAALGTSPRLRKATECSLFDYLISMPTTEL